MTRSGRAHGRAAATALFVLLGAAAVDAQVDSTAAANLPAAEQILARYHQAIGAARFANIASMHATGELAIPVAGISGTLEVWQARPNRTVMHASVPGFGDVRTGFTGTNGWSIDPGDGPRVLGGPEAVQAEDDAHFESHLRSPALIEFMTAVERTTVGGYDCYMVRMVWKSGRETSDCFSLESGLLVGSVRTHQASTGPVEAVLLYEGYGLFEGVLIPTRITTHVEGVDQVITLRNVTLNGAVDADFVPPPEIRRLLGG